MFNATGNDALAHIYSSILSQHLSMSNFAAALVKLAPTVVNAALMMHAKVTTTFWPTAIKFHYSFNLRDLSNIFQGMLFALPECCKLPTDLVRLYIHEARRVYMDKLVDGDDFALFHKVQGNVIATVFEVRTCV